MMVLTAESMCPGSFGGVRSWMERPDKRRATSSFILFAVLDGQPNQGKKK